MKPNTTITAIVAGLALAGAVARADEPKELKKEAPKPEAASAAKPKAPKMGPKKVLEKYDSNGDGKITGAEAEALRKAFAGKFKESLERYDKDGNGKLDDSEVAAIKPKGAGKEGEAGKKKKKDKPADKPAPTPAPAPAKDAK